jgi:hypothetical protein
MPMESVVEQDQPSSGTGRLARQMLGSGMDSPAVRAPDFPDTREWIHTGGRRMTLADFRGRILLLDFWTYG